MSLATRCTACGTIFRVVEDQLRVSDGWVRCGRCAEVFDARQQLFDIEQEAPPPWAGRATAPEPAAPVPASVPASVPAPMQRAVPEPAPAIYAEPEPARQAPLERDEPMFVSRADPRGDIRDDIRGDMRGDVRDDTRDDVRGDMRAGIREDMRPPLRAEPDARFAERTEPVFAPAPLPPTPEPEVVVEPHLAALVAGLGDEGRLDPALLSSPTVATPSFLRQAQAKERWRRPGVRIALASGCVLAAVLLFAQMSLQFRDAMASLWPQTAPTLRAACASLGCEVHAWRRIDAIAVEQSGLSQAGAGNNYKLTLTLLNKSGQNLALPWVDLSLTDVNGQVVSRRMLSPTDFNIRTDTIAGGAEQALSVVFSTGQQKVTGYTVEIFHP